MLIEWTWGNNCFFLVKTPQRAFRFRLNLSLNFERFRVLSDEQVENPFASTSVVSRDLAAVPQIPLPVAGLVSRIHPR
jgi:hypothetical protein